MVPNPLPGQVGHTSLSCTPEVVERQPERGFFRGGCFGKTERRWAPAAWPWQRMQIGAAPDSSVPTRSRFFGAICARAGHTSCRSVRIVSKSTVRFHFATTIPGWNPFESERKMRGFSFQRHKWVTGECFVRRTYGHGGIRFRTSGLNVKAQSGRLAEPSLPLSENVGVSTVMV